MTLPGRRSDSTRRLSINLFSEIGFLELARSKYVEGDEKAAEDWFAKFVLLNAFRQLPGADKLRVLTHFFTDVLTDGAFGLVQLLLRRLKLEDRPLYGALGQPFQLAAEYFQRHIPDRQPTRTEVLAALRRVGSSLPLPPETP